MSKPNLPRPAATSALLDALRRAPIVALLGARQVGKTTLARSVAARWPGPTTHFDLEDEADLSRLTSPSLALRDLRGLVVLDEAQRRPDLFPLLRVLADRPASPARFLLLGSASPDLVRTTSESLAGRVTFLDLPGFGLEDVGAEHCERLWLRGGFPRSYLAASDDQSYAWRQDFVRTFLHQDLAALGIGLPAESLRRLWTMLAHLHGATLNLSDLGRNLGVGHTTVRRWLETLAGTYVVRLVRPFHENLGKRLVKSPKVYVADTGLLHALLKIRSHHDLTGNPVVGTSWESFVMETVRRRLGTDPSEVHFYRTATGVELDMVVVHGGRRLGFEVKRTDAPTVTKGMRVALDDLSLARLDVVHAGRDTYPLDRRIRALSLHRVEADLPPL